MRSQTIAARIAIGFASLALLGGCAATPLPSPSPARSPSSAPVTPYASPPSPIAKPSAAPSVSVEPTSGLAWYRIGSIPSGGRPQILDAVGLTKGYVAVERSRSVWFSSDGRTWREIELPFTATKDEYGRFLDASARAVATDGTRVLVVGGYSHEPCRAPDPPDNPSTEGSAVCPRHPLAWVSDDGVTWQSAHPGPQPAEPPGYNQGSEFVAAWPVPTGGWDAALSYFGTDGSLVGRDLWHSSDGIRWTELEPAPAPDLEGSPQLPWVHEGAADQKGIRVLWQGWSDFTSPAAVPGGVPVMTLATSPDGRSWTTVDGFAGGGAEIHAGVAPAVGANRWVLVGESGISEVLDRTASGPTVWTSQDRVGWAATILPIPAGLRGGPVTSVVLTRAGYVAVGLNWDAGAPRPWTRLSEDGLTWVELPPVGTSGADSDPPSVADGPAGVIGIEGSPTNSTGETGVWQLR
jgi:hypothetical protein